MKKFLILMLLVALAGGYAAAQDQPAAPAAAGLLHFGYPQVLASLNLEPGQEAKITLPDQFTSGKVYGYATYTIPAGAFTVPVRFEILASPNSEWDKTVSSDLAVVANFAFRVVDRKTNQLIEKFNEPIEYSLSDSMITSNSVYWATTASEPIKLIDVSRVTKISGTTLDSAPGVASVGWIITTPKQDLQMGMGR